MNKSLQFILEIIRLILIIIISLLVLGFVQQKIIQLLGFTEFNWVLIFIADLFLIYVLYKNKLQFSGWFKSSYNQPLSSRSTKFALWGAILCFIVGIVFNIIF